MKIGTLSSGLRSRAHLALTSAVLLCLLLVVGCSKPVQEAAKVDDRPAYAQNDPRERLDRTQAKEQREALRQKENERKRGAAGSSPALDALPGPEPVPADAPTIDPKTLETAPSNLNNPAIIITLASGEQIIAELFAKDTPKTVAQFMKQVSQGYHDGGAFNRSDDLCIQGGDPAYIPNSKPWDSIPLESSSVPFDRGSLGLARTDAPDSGNSQFFIVKKDADACAHLNRASAEKPGYCHFGRVLKGMGVVDAMPARDLKDRSPSVSNSARITSIKLARFEGAE
jgi:cyclophilin family peptidyl-prolyl cis-trans isomerase